MNLRAFAVLGAALLGCAQERLRGAAGTVELLGDPIEFEPTWPGATRTRVLSIRNPGRGPAHFVASVSPPFTASPASGQLAGGAWAELTVSFRPEATGEFEAALRVDGGATKASLRVSGVGKPAPPCPEVQCLAARFDPEEGGCAYDPVADGTSCADACARSAICVVGRCIGNVIACDDDDPCTADACDPARGCVHGARSCAPPSNPCEVLSCDSKAGWTAVAVQDGTPCGRDDGELHDVCVAGECVPRVPPDGVACRTGSPCQAPGTVQGGLCVQPLAFPLSPAWVYLAQGYLTEPMADEAGNVYFLDREFREHTEDVLVSLGPDGVVRYRHLVTRPALLSFVDGGRLFGALDFGLVTAFSAATGAVIWQRDLLTTLRPLAAPTVCLEGSSGPTDVVKVWVEDLIDAGSRGVAALVSLHRSAEVGDCYDGAFLVYLDPATGAVRSARHIAVRASIGSIGRDGAIFLAARMDTGGSKQWSLLALEPDGARRWLRPRIAWIGGMTDSALLESAMVGDGRSVFRAVSTETGADGTAYPADEATELVYSTYAAWGGGAVVAVGEPYAPLDAWKEQVLLGIHAEDGETRWTAPLANGDRDFTRDHSDPIVTDRGTSLLVHRSLGETYVSERGGDGRLLYQCSLESGAGLFRHGVLLERGLLLVESTYRIEAYALPGRSTARFGWPTWRADSQRRGRFREPGEVPCE